MSLRNGADTPLLDLAVAVGQLISHGSMTTAYNFVSKQPECVLTVSLEGMQELGQALQAAQDYLLEAGLVRGAARVGARPHLT